MLKVGQRVVCVDDVGTLVNMPGAPAFEISEGSEYVIRWSGMHCDPFAEGTYAGVRLVGVTRPVNPMSGEADKPFAARRFRPVVESKTEKKLTAGVE